MTFVYHVETHEVVEVSVMFDTEVIMIGDDRYLTEDIVSGRIRTVSFDEEYARTSGENSDWIYKGLDTYSKYHSQTPEPTPEPEPEPTPEPEPEPEPTPEPEPEPEPYDGIIESVRGKGKLKGTNVADAFTFDSFDVFTKKAADKIIGFDASEGDTIAVSHFAFPALQGASDISFVSTTVSYTHLTLPTKA